jgi:hypothetical protein
VGRWYSGITGFDMMRSVLKWEQGLILDKIESKYGREWFTWVEIEEFCSSPMTLGAMMRDGLLDKQGLRNDSETKERLPSRWQITATGIRKLATFRERLKR